MGAGRGRGHQSYTLLFLLSPPSVQELMQEKEDLAAQLQQVRDNVVELRQQLKAAYEGQKQAEAARDEAEMTVLEVQYATLVGR